MNGTLSLAEVEVIGSPGTNTNPVVSNVALSGTATQSSTDFGVVPGRAIDGNTNGRWRASTTTHIRNSNQPWWQLRLAQTGTIEEIVLFNRTDSCCSSRLSNYTVTILNDAGRIVFTQSFGQAPSFTNTINTGRVTGRTVRIQLNGSNALSRAEVQVMGY